MIVHTRTSTYLHPLHMHVQLYGHTSIYHVNWLTACFDEQPYQYSFDKLLRPKPAPARSHSQPAVSRMTHPGGSKSETLRLNEGLWQSFCHAIYDLSTTEVFRSGVLHLSSRRKISVYFRCASNNWVPKKRNDLPPINNPLWAPDNIYVIKFHFGKACFFWNHHEYHFHVSFFKKKW